MGMNTQLLMIWWRDWVCCKCWFLCLYECPNAVDLTKFSSSSFSQGEQKQLTRPKPLSTVLTSPCSPETAPLLKHVSIRHHTASFLIFKSHWCHGSRAWGFLGLCNLQQLWSPWLVRRQQHCSVSVGCCEFWAAQSSSVLLPCSGTPKPPQHPTWGRVGSVPPRWGALTSASCVSLNSSTTSESCCCEVGCVSPAWVSEVRAKLNTRWQFLLETVLDVLGSTTRVLLPRLVSEDCLLYDWITD